MAKFLRTKIVVLPPISVEFEEDLDRLVIYTWGVDTKGFATATMLCYIGLDALSLDAGDNVPDYVAREIANGPIAALVRRNVAAMLKEARQSLLVDVEAIAKEEPSGGQTLESGREGPS